MRDDVPRTQLSILECTRMLYLGTGVRERIPHAC